MKDINILIVEDESIVAMEIENYIQKFDYNVVGICQSYAAVMKIIKKHEIHIILLDINLIGDKDGVDVAIKVRKIYPNIEIIFLTAHTDIYNVDRAIQLSPIAYLSKPFKRDELQIFFKIAMKKIENKLPFAEENTENIILDKEFQYTPETKSLFLYNEQVHVTKKELLFLDLLISYRNTIVPIEKIKETIWPGEEVNISTIRNLVKRLRQKLNHKFITTSSSLGYMIKTKS